MTPRARTPPAAAHRAPGAGRNGAGRRVILDPIITMNAGGIIQSASDSVEQVFGWTPTELFGKNVKVLIPEPRRSALDRYLDRYRHTPRAETLKRVRCFDAVRKDGTVIQIELSMSRADLPVHASPFFIGIVRDVSHESEPGSVADEARLQMLITEQTRALATANLRLHLADRMASLGTLAAGLGHDMNNVLLPVRARLNALEHAGISSTALTHVSAVRQSIAYLQHLSDGLHFLALDPDGPGAAHDGAGSTDVEEWWGRVGGLLRKAVPKHVTLRASFPKRLPMVQIAPHWLTQAMLNLIVNAGEAIPEGRRPGQVRIWAAAADGGKTVKLGVTDNGRGMTAAVQRRAVDLFFTTKTRSMGTGLGLPLARKVALRAGGELELRSEPGKGTTVEMTLNVAAPGAAAGAPGPVAGRWASVSTRDERVAALIAQVLMGGGFSVKPGRGRGPGSAALWVTDPTAPALAAAMRWRKGRAARAVVLLGAPSKVSARRWKGVGATVVDRPGEFESIRRGLGVAMEGLSNSPRKGAKT